MKKTIDAFLEGKEIAIAGVSTNQGNWGLMLTKELKKKGYRVYPVNPRYDEIEGFKCYQTVKELPETAENLILAVNPERAQEIIGQCPGTSVKRVWMHQGVGIGAYSKAGLALLKENNLEFVFGFCPMMFFGKGMHKIHFWFRKNMGKTPVEFYLN
ncbi:MAG: CoA-binding protein [Bacteroidales bacterium]